MAPSPINEKALVEDPALALFQEVGWTTKSLLQEFDGGASSEGRETKRQPYLPARLREALARLNPGLDSTVIDKAVEEITRSRSSMAFVAANKEVVRLLRDRIPVPTVGEDGQPTTVHVTAIDWENPSNNEFLMASQVWFAGDLGQKRADAVGFVNGIPLLFCEFKAPTQPVSDALDGNLKDYRATIPHVFAPTGFGLISNGHDTRLGAVEAPWEHWLEWKRLEEEDAPTNSLEVAIRGACEPARFLDIVENFVVFQEEAQKSGQVRLIKKVARNHQVLGVNRAIQAVQDLRSNQGRLGVFWHTQGSGKSLSMVMFGEKVHRKVKGNWTFVVVTDRQELDDQIARTFAECGAVTEDIHEVQASSSADLRRLLREDHRYLFTLIHKFRPEPGKAMEVLSDRSDIIVITDEAHRSQYDVLALNMRTALPNAAFIGFTGTPLIKGEEERTREVFGDYVSVYDFGQSIADGATVPLYYENRIPEVRLANGGLGDDFENLVEEASIDEEVEARLQRQFAQEYALLTRDDRLETIAKDVVRHFTGRGYRGKAMFVAVDKATAVRMYDKVQAHWQTMLAEKKAVLDKAAPEDRQALQADYDWLRETDMAVVVSQGQNEIEELAKKGLDIIPHRKRMVNEDLDLKFKDPDDRLRLVFVCAMWITGFDVPTCSTIYLDKPMRNHTLMQTIARANRTARGKTAGLIVDYVGVFGNLKRALEIYAAGGRDAPAIRDKGALVEDIQRRLRETKEWMTERGISVDAIVAAEGLAKSDHIGGARAKLTLPDDVRMRFLRMSSELWACFKSALPDPLVGALFAEIDTVRKIDTAIREHLPKPKIGELAAEMEDLLDRSVVGIEITRPLPDPDSMDGLVNLGAIDFERLKALFAKGRGQSAVQLARNEAEKRAKDLAAQNPTRQSFLDRYQQLVAAYNERRMTAEEIFSELMRLIDAMAEEDRRHARENLGEEELALFDVLTQPDPQLPETKRDEVKDIARDLLGKLKNLFTGIDWQANPTMRAKVRTTIKGALRRLPDEYDDNLWEAKIAATVDWVFRRYGGPSASPP